MTVGLLSAKIVMSFKLMTNTFNTLLDVISVIFMSKINVFCAFIYMFIIIIFAEPKIRAPLYFIFYFT